MSKSDSEAKFLIDSKARDYISKHNMWENSSTSMTDRDWTIKKLVMTLLTLGLIG